MKHKETADGVNVLLHVAWAVLTAGGTMILWIYFIYFYGAGSLTVSL